MVLQQATSLWAVHGHQRALLPEDIPLPYCPACPRPHTCLFHRKQGKAGPNIFRTSLYRDRRLQPQHTSPASSAPPDLTAVCQLAHLTSPSRACHRHLLLSSRISYPSMTSVTLQSQAWIFSERLMLTTPRPLRARLCLHSLPSQPHRSPVLIPGTAQGLGTAPQKLPHGPARLCTWAQIQA